MIITGLQDLTYLDWTKTRHSSGTAGSFLKSYENINGKKIYYKLSNYDSVHGITGHECVNEIVVSRLLDILNIPHLSYDLIHANIKIRDVSYETYLCRSNDFKKPGDSKIALDAFYDMERLPDESPLDFCIRYGWERYIYEMLIVDFLIANRDRHGANIEVLRNRRAKSLSPAPLFDHGVSLFFSADLNSDITKIDPLEDKKVQSFIGGSSLYENLNLVPQDFLIELPCLDDNARDYIFNDISSIMGDSWICSVWNFIKRRAEIYEDLRNKR